ncbi:transglutaminase domain-containing protein [Catalinimonas niigatensis]|uniref:transglutaminase domain-containing protein n=1 Tax=Catalinimonas niigatensis TaxID=1397264 RepID=UPI00266664A0|nr:transglutaminase domain-containing protein [Catalinimonas niigatensis]WPP52566.1 transglutaminase domain-containing protein [Catalinimonas niigatensis]
MKKLKLLSFLLLLAQVVLANPPSEYSEIDMHARSTPAKYAKNVQELARYLVKPAKNDFEKVRSFYVWMAENIAYDVNLFRTYRPGSSLTITAEDVLKKRKAVCQGYADLFTALSQEVGIKSQLVAGYSKGFGNQNRKDFSTADHAWNAVYLDGKWYLLDATWGAGGLNDKMQYVSKFNEQYFLSDPKIFIKDHMPLQPMWQLLDCPISMQAFTGGDAAIAQELAANKKCENYNQQILAIEKLDGADQELKLAEEAYLFNSANHVVMARAYMNYAHHIMSNVKRELKSREEIQEVVGSQEEALQYLKKAYGLLQKVKDGSADVEKDFVSKNIKHSEDNLKAMKAALKG